MPPPGRPSKASVGRYIFSTRLTHNTLNVNIYQPGIRSGRPRRHARSPPRRHTVAKRRPECPAAGSARPVRRSFHTRHCGRNLAHRCCHRMPASRRRMIEKSTFGWRSLRCEIIAYLHTPTSMAGPTRACAKEPGSASHAELPSDGIPGGWSRTCTPN